MATKSYEYNSSTENYNQNNLVTKRDKFNMEVDDDGYSSKIAKKVYSMEKIVDIDSDAYTSILHSHNQFRRNEIDLYNKTYRFGLFNPYGALTNTREFLFFTKPDLHIMERDDSSGVITGDLVEGIRYSAYWVDLYQNRSKIISLLQSSYGQNTNDPFNHLLQNQVISNLEIPSLESTTIETAVNMHGVGFSYHGSSEASDDNRDFSLEFKDTKWLDVYYYFKTFEEYETLKHHGTIRPWKKYIENKVIHDQFAIYKFLVDEDMETIIYYCKYYGVMPTSLPRDVFSNSVFDNGISYTINFKAAFFEDMRPDIIADFNNLTKDYFRSQKYDIDIYNSVLGRVDNRPTTAAYVEKVESKISPTGFVYKLKWRGSDKV